MSSSMTQDHGECDRNASRIKLILIREVMEIGQIYVEEAQMCSSHIFSLSFVLFMGHFHRWNASKIYFRLNSSIICIEIYFLTGNLPCWKQPAHLFAHRHYCQHVMVVSVSSFVFSAVFADQCAVMLSLEKEMFSDQTTLKDAHVSSMCAHSTV